jgi:hypothetical protein
MTWQTISVIILTSIVYFGSLTAGLLLWKNNAHEEALQFFIGFGLLTAIIGLAIFMYFLHI